MDHRKSENSRKTPTSALLITPKPLTVWITTNSEKFLKRWEYQITLPASGEIYMQVKKLQLELNMEQQTGSKLGKEYFQAVYCHPAYLTYMESTSCKMPGWMKHKLQMTPPLWQKLKRNWRASWWVRGEWKVTLKVNIQKTKIMASGPITSWQTDGETMEIVTDFILLDYKITADGDCSHEIKRCLLLGRRATTNLDSILKSRDITSPTNVHLVKTMVFPVVMYGCESWTIKKAEHWRTDAFELWCWKRLLRVPWTARRSNQFILKEISPEYLLEGLMLKLQLQHFGHLMWTGKDLDAGKDWRQEEKGMTEDEMVGWHHWLDGHESEQAPRVVDDREAWCAAIHGVTELDMTEQLYWLEP